MARRFNQEAVVRIWRKAPGGLLKAKKHPGHASLTIRGSILTGHLSVPEGGTREGGQNVLDSVYVSWYPDDVGFFGLFLDALEKKKYWKIPLIGIAPELFEMEGEDETSYYADQLRQMSKETREKLLAKKFPPKSGQKVRLGEAIRTGADGKVYIPGLGATGQQIYWGLGTKKIADWWNGFKETGMYQMYSTDMNCAGVVVTALKKGGAEAYFHVPTVKSLMDPNVLGKWALQLQAAIILLNGNTTAFEQKANKVLGSRRLRAGNELMTVKAWGNHILWRTTFGTRHRLTDKKRMSEITTLLRAYHRLNWNTADTFGQKLGYLSNIMKKLMDHHYATQGIQWYYASLLGKQIINVLNSDDVTGR